jgi:hypothetical protein
MAKRIRPPRALWVLSGSVAKTKRPFSQRRGYRHGGRVPGRRRAKLGWLQRRGTVI